MIAMALACNPKLLIADEPTTALDVTVQAQILDLIAQLKDSFGMSVLLITHDLGVIAEMCNRVIVMYAGQVIETADVFELFENPLHPYTKALISSVPVPNPKLRKLRNIQPIQGEISSPINPPACCLFASRCPYAMKICTEQIPQLKAVEASHQVACFLY
jgi:oligopeptide/dipeptide ABC transporter ATP-binding protein